MSIVDELLAKKPETRTVPIPLDPALAERYTEAKTQHEQAKRSSDAAPKDTDRAAEVERCRAELDALAEELKPHMSEFVLRSVSPTEFEELKTANRPTERQRTDYRKAGVEAPEWNPDTFQPALVAKACLSITTSSGTQEDALRIWQSDAWNVGVRNELFGAALSAYFSFTKVDLGKG
jgi:anti-sigma-K factor RskA